MNQTQTAPAVDRTALVSSVFEIAKRPFYAANGWKVLDDVSADDLDTVIGRKVRTVRGAARQVLNRLIKPAQANTETVAAVVAEAQEYVETNGVAVVVEDQPELQNADVVQGEQVVADVLDILNGPAAE